MTRTFREVLHVVLWLPILLLWTAPAHAARLFALVNTGEIFSSTDHGVTWTIRAAIAEHDAVALQARTSGDDLFMAGASGSIYHSVDGGTSWIVAGTVPAGDLVDMTILGNGNIVILTESGDVYESADLGASFTPLAALISANCTSLAKRSDDLLFALTRTGEVYLSADGGASWVVQGGITTSHAVRLRANGTLLYTITSTGDVYESADSGAAWTAVGTLSQVGTTGFTVDSGTLVAATREGHIATSSDGAVWVWSGSTNQLSLTALAVDTPAVTGLDEPAPSALTVGQPWPNPAPDTGALSLTFTAASAEMINVRMADAAGRVVAQRPPTAYPAGIHTIEWEPGVRGSGVYFVRIETSRGVIATRSWAVVR